MFLAAAAGIKQWQETSTAVSAAEFTCHWKQRTCRENGIAENTDNVSKHRQLNVITCWTDYEAVKHASKSNPTTSINNETRTQRMSRLHVIQRRVCCKSQWRDTAAHHHYHHHHCPHHHIHHHQQPPLYRHHATSHARVTWTWLAMVDLSPCLSTSYLTNRHTIPNTYNKHPAWGESNQLTTLRLQPNQHFALSFISVNIQCLFTYSMANDRAKVAVAACGTGRNSKFRFLEVVSPDPYNIRVRCHQRRSSGLGASPVRLWNC